MARIPRWIPLVLTLVLIAGAFGVMGCGGDEEPPPTTAPPAPPATLPATGEVASTNPWDALIGTTLEPGESTPSEVSEALTERRPVVLLFYVPGNVDDTRVLESMQALEATYSDVTFLFYDYKAPAAYGDLAQMLQVNYPPQGVFIDTRGTIQDVSSGYIDEGTLNQAVVNLRQG
jgi:hypothetical protein